MLKQDISGTSITTADVSKLSSNQPKSLIVIFLFLLPMSDEFDNDFEDDFDDDIEDEYEDVEEDRS